MKKVERATLWFGNGGIANVRPVNGTKFTLEEQQAAVCGYIQGIVPRYRGHQIWVNEEGKSMETVL